MDDNNRLSRFLNRLLQQTGGNFIYIVVIIMQVVSNLGAIPAAYFIQINAEMTPDQFNASTQLTLSLMLMSNLIMLGATRIYARQAMLRLNQWRRGKSLEKDAPKELLAWKQISSLTWRYAFTAYISSFVIVIVPLMTYQYYALHVSGAQIIYTLIGGAIAGLGIVTFGLVILENLLEPARIVLLPTSVDTQLSGMAGYRLPGKQIGLIVVATIMSVLLIAPIGYHQTINALQYQNAEILTTLRTQSIVVGLLTILIVAGLAYLFARTINQPITSLINTFNKVEQGDLKQRATVAATDEIGELAIHFNNMIARMDDLQQNLEKQVEEGTSLLRAVNEVGRVASSILDPDELISKVVNLITDQFGYYYTALFLVDSNGKWAELIEATGEAGHVLKENKHKLEVGGRSMVGTAISTGQPRIALDVGDEPVRFQNPLLPYTRSEIALPLIVGDRIFGALDVQSTQEAAFGSNEIDTLLGMANQVAIAVENARLFQQAQQNLEEMRAIQRQYLLTSWKVTGEKENLEYNIGDDELSPHSSEIDIPMALRDEIIGQITLTGDEEWSPEQRALVEDVATQAALALENARLVEESQTSATLEHLVAEITGKIWASTTMDGILQTAIRELSHALNISEASIELNVDTTYE